MVHYSSGPRYGMISYHHRAPEGTLDAKFLSICPVQSSERGWPEAPMAGMAPLTPTLDWSRPRALSRPER